MKRFAAAVFCTALLAASDAQAGLNGQDIFSLCTEPENKESEAMCLGYIMASWDLLYNDADERLCTPNGFTGFTLTEAIIKSLKAEPPQAMVGAASIIQDRARTIYACR